MWCSVVVLIGYYELCLGRLVVDNYIEIATSSNWHWGGVVSNREVMLLRGGLCMRGYTLLDFRTSPKKKYVCVCVFLEKE